MAEFVGGKSVVVDVGEPITFENKTDVDFNVGYGVVFRKSGLYRVSVNGKHTSIAIEQERKKGQWRCISKLGETFKGYRCSECTELVYGKTNFCPNCGCKMEMEK